MTASVWFRGNPSFPRALYEHWLLLLLLYILQLLQQNLPYLCRVGLGSVCNSGMSITQKCITKTADYMQRINAKIILGSTCTRPKEGSYFSSTLSKPTSQVLQVVEVNIQRNFVVFLGAAEGTKDAVTFSTLLKPGSHVCACLPSKGKWGRFCCTAAAVGTCTTTSITRLKKGVSSHV